MYGHLQTPVVRFSSSCAPLLSHKPKIKASVFRSWTPQSIIFQYGGSTRGNHCETVQLMAYMAKSLTWPSHLLCREKYWSTLRNIEFKCLQWRVWFILHTITLWVGSGGGFFCSTITVSMYIKSQLHKDLVWPYWCEGTLAYTEPWPQPYLLPLGWFGMPFVSQISLSKVNSWPYNGSFGLMGRNTPKFGGKPFQKGWRML